MKLRNQPTLHYQAGFSLVEIMVGLVIGLLATLVIMQVFSVFEGQKRTTTGSSDAQTNGSIALYSIEREVQSAGYALQPSTDSPIECTAPVIDANTGVGSLFPITITDGGAASDSITIRYGSSNSGGILTPITANPAGSVVPVNDNLSCNVNDVALIIQNINSCNVTSVTAVTGNMQITLNDPTGAVANANIACLGTWHEVSYQIASNGLQRQDHLGKTNAIATTFVPIVADIVNMQAQYGISATASSNVVSQWVNATGSWAAPTVADRNRIKSIRIAVVARNELQEKNIVTNTCTTANGTVNKGPCAWDDANLNASPQIDLSINPDGSMQLFRADGTQDWQYYRYRVYETIIPLRNVIWSQGTL